jgi:hypothetical protein
LIKDYFGIQYVGVKKWPMKGDFSILEQFLKIAVRPPVEDHLQQLLEGCFTLGRKANLIGVG